MRNIKNFFSNLALYHHCLRFSSDHPCIGAEWAVQSELRRISEGWKAACRDMCTRADLTHTCSCFLCNNAMNEKTEHFFHFLKCQFYYANYKDCKRSICLCLIPEVYIKVQWQRIELFVVWQTRIRVWNLFHLEITLWLLLTFL